MSDREDEDVSFNLDMTAITGDSATGSSSSVDTVIPPKEAEKLHGESKRPIFHGGDQSESEADDHDREDADPTTKGGKKTDPKESISAEFADPMPSGSKDMDPKPSTSKDADPTAAKNIRGRRKYAWISMTQR